MRQEVAGSIEKEIGRTAAKLHSRRGGSGSVTILREIAVPRHSQLE
jgi:hypothetical protein